MKGCNPNHAARKLSEIGTHVRGGSGISGEGQSLYVNILLN